MTNLVSAATSSTVMNRLYRHLFNHESSSEVRILLIFGLVVIAHLIVRTVHYISESILARRDAKRNRLGLVTQKPKFITITRLIVSSVTFVVYFLAIGLILQEIGVNLKAYLASASVVGLAISFGSQGLVQDMVIGLTLIFSDTMDVGDLVEISGSTIVSGRVEEIGLRFTRVVNFFNQEVFIPNRTIANVSRFPLGGIYAFADIQIPLDVDANKSVQLIENVAAGMWRQFGAIILDEPLASPMEDTAGALWKFLRIRFKIWPGQGALIENTFRQQVVSTMKSLKPDYSDWQVSVTYRAATDDKKVRSVIKQDPAPIAPKEP